MMLAFSASPSTTANHGLLASYTSDPGTCVMEFVGTYDSGDGNAQTWIFVVAAAGTCGPVAEQCSGFGSLEVGFVGTGCTNAWSTGPTPDAHVFPRTLDTHTGIAMSIAGVSTTGTLVSLG